MSPSLESLMSGATGRPSTVLGDLLTFLCIGATGAIGFVALSSVLVGLGTGVENWLVNAISYGTMIVPIYLLHRQFSFRSERSHWHSMPRYVSVQAMSLVLVSLFSFVVYSLFAVPAVLASGIVIGLTSGINFMVLRRWAFAPDAPVEGLAAAPVALPVRN